MRRGLKLASIDRPVKSGLKQLDTLTNVIDFLPLTREVMEIASDLWAQARSQGKATANDKNIDGDMIIAAHWSILSAKYPGREVVVVTTNVKHLGYFTNAYTRSIFSATKTTRNKGFFGEVGFLLPHMLF